MSILTGIAIEDIQADRIEIAKKYAKQWGKVVVLKGALTIVASSTGKICIIPVATSALAHAGTGDVLAGMVASLLGQGVSAYEAAIAGAYLHAQAGIAAIPIIGSEASILAMDVIEQIGGVVGKLSEQK
jgi:NAD(P)H-hydrate epimerase